MAAFATASCTCNKPTLLNLWGVRQIYSFEQCKWIKLNYHGRLEQIVQSFCHLCSKCTFRRRLCLCTSCLLSGQNLAAESKSMTEVIMIQNRDEQASSCLSTLFSCMSFFGKQRRFIRTHKCSFTVRLILNASVCCCVLLYHRNFHLHLKDSW